MVFGVCSYMRLAMNTQANRIYGVLHKSVHSKILIAQDIWSLPLKPSSFECFTHSRVEAAN